MAHRVEVGSPTPAPPDRPNEPMAGSPSPAVLVADPAKRAGKVPPPPNIKPKGAERLFASAIVQSKIDVTFEREGRTHQVSLDLPPSSDGIKRGRFSSGPITGEYETRFLPDGGGYYHLLIDKTGETRLPNGQEVAFREGVVGFRNSAKGISFQASTGRRIATGAPIHAPPEELYRIAQQLYGLATGRIVLTGISNDLLTFLSDETDLGLLTATVNFVIDPKFRSREDGNWRAEKILPVLANPYIGRAEQKGILIELVESAGNRLLSERLYRIGSVNRTLAAQEAIFELATELTGPAYQKKPGLDEMARQTAALRGIELLGFLSPVKAGPSLPDSDMLKAVDLALAASISDHPIRRLAANKSLSSIFPTLRPELDRQATARILAMVKSAAWSSRVETDDALAEARVNFLAHLVLNGEVEGLTVADRDALYSAVSSQLERGRVTTAVAVAALAVFGTFPPGDTPLRESQSRLVKAFTKQMKGLPVRADAGGFSVRIRDRVAEVMLGREFGSSDVLVPRVRINLYRAVTDEDPEWTQKLSDSLAMDVEARFGRPTQQGKSDDETRVFVLADLERWLKRDRRDLLSLDNSDEPPGELIDTLRYREWSAQERPQILERLLGEAVPHLWNHLSGDDWVSLAYDFARRYQMMGTFYTWLDTQWATKKEPHLVIAVGRGLDGPARDPEVRRRLLTYVRQLVEAGSLTDPRGLQAVRQVILGLRDPADGQGRYLADKMLDAALDVATLPKGDEETGYALYDRVYDLNILQANGFISKDRLGAVANFYARAFTREPIPYGLFPSASQFRESAHAAGVKTPRLDAALREFAHLGHIPVHVTMSAQQFFDIITSSGDRDERIRAAQEGKFIVLNRRFVRDRMAGRPFNPADERSLQLLEAGLGIGMHDHAGTVAEEAERSYAYAVAVLTPPSAPGGEMEPLLIVRDGKTVARPNKKSDFRVFALDVTGTISERSIASAREALTMLPRQHTARFLGVEGHTRDRQRHSAGLREMVHPEGRRGVGRPTRYTMRIYDTLDLDTAVHAVIHPVWDSLSWEDQRRFEALHRASRDPTDFAEPYGLTDPIEDFTTLGTAWVRDSEKTLKAAVDLALKGHPIPLQKLLIFLKGYSEGCAKLPAHQFEGDSWQQKIRSAEFVYQKPPLDEIREITAGSSTYSFGYTGSQLATVNGRNLTNLPVLPVTGQPFAPQSIRDPQYHPK